MLVRVACAVAQCACNATPLSNPHAASDLRSRGRLSVSAVSTLKLRRLTLQLSACSLFGTKPAQIRPRKRMCSVNVAQFLLKAPQ